MDIWQWNIQKFERDAIQRILGRVLLAQLSKNRLQRWAKRYDTKIVSIYDVRLDSSLKNQRFPEMTDEWLDFIIDCRAGKTHNYDIVIGAMADDQIYNYISDYMDGSDYERAVLGAGKFKYPTHQINFAQTKQLKCLEYRDLRWLRMENGRESRKDNDLFLPVR